ncbi:gas vesicle protein, partial [Kitasatospora cineracea]|uniref:gas vesicle protein GvpO n=1 Tax=Kitasatospora cineracea TaxID=88074 RepID=UPI0033CF5CC9
GVAQDVRDGHRLLAVGGELRQVPGNRAAGRAAAQVRAMTGRSPEGVTSVERTEDGWRIGVEVVESHRIPDSTDILAVYRVDLDHDGDLLAYRRESRYPRGRFPGQEDPP